jgi:phosphate transport system substrate-binding protein
MIMSMAAFRLYSGSGSGRWLNIGSNSWFGERSPDRPVGWLPNRLALKAGQCCRMSRISLAAFLLSVCLGSTACHAADAGVAKGPSPLQGTLILSGSSTMAPLLEAIGKRFTAQHPAVQIRMHTTGSVRGIEDVAGGKADIGMASRSLTDKESGLYSFAIARDGVCLVVHKNNPVRSLTNAQVAGIFTGRIANWSAAGGKDTPIAPINAKAGMGAVELFTHYFGIRYADIKTPIVVSGNLDRIKALVENPGGITYMSIGWAQREVDRGVPVKLLPVDGVAATTRNIRSGNFPISRPLVLVTREVPAGLVKAFITFSLSSEITDLVVQHDFVPYLD